MTNWPYLFPGASKSKSEPNLFPLTLKVEAYKVVSDFDFEAQGESYGRFVIFLCILPTGATCWANLVTTYRR